MSRQKGKRDRQQELEIEPIPESLRKRGRRRRSKKYKEYRARKILLAGKAWRMGQEQARVNALLDNDESPIEDELIWDGDTPRGEPTDGQEGLGEPGGGGS